MGECGEPACDEIHIKLQGFVIIKDFILTSFGPLSYQLQGFVIIKDSILTGFGPLSYQLQGFVIIKDSILTGFGLYPFISNESL